MKLTKWIGRLPGAHRLHHLGTRALHVARSLRSPYLRFVPAGHFYSPLPEASVSARDPLAPDPIEIPGIDLAEEEQLGMLDRMGVFASALPWSNEPREGLRYHYGNPFFNDNDAIVLYGMLRAVRPARVVEVGSGWSSAAMLDTIDTAPELSPSLTFVEPYPDRLLGLLREGDRESAVIIAKPAQEVPLDIFTRLAAGDILFIDSSHVLKSESDVGFLLFEVLPRLRAGVIVHIHDVFWPFEYPKAWYEEGRAWTEAFAVRAFLLHNSAFRILYFNSFISRRHRERLRSVFPAALADSGQSLWLRRL